jgi:hypothetical protein
MELVSLLIFLLFLTFLTLYFRRSERRKSSRK